MISFPEFNQFNEENGEFETFLTQNPSVPWHQASTISLGAWAESCFMLYSMEGSWLETVMMKRRTGRCVFLWDEEMNSGGTESMTHDFPQISLILSFGMPSFQSWKGSISKVCPMNRKCKGFSIFKMHPSQWYMVCFHFCNVNSDTKTLKENQYIFGIGSCTHQTPQKLHHNVSRYRWTVRQCSKLINKLDRVCGPDSTKTYRQAVEFLWSPAHSNHYP